MPTKGSNQKRQTVLYSLAEIANMYGIDKGSLKALEIKRLIVPSVYGSQGVAHLYPLEEVRKAASLPPPPSQASTRPAKKNAAGEETHPVSTIETFQTAKGRKMSADATRAEIALAKERGTAIDPNIIKSHIDDMFTKVRTRLRAVPDKVASILKLTPAQVQVIADAVDEALNELSNGANVIERARTAERDDRDIEPELDEPEASGEDDS